MHTIPFFSIIIPTYNRAHIISNVLSCLEKQTFKNFETIIVDNCSNDNIKEVLNDKITSNEITSGFIYKGQSFY